MKRRRRRGPNMDAIEKWQICELYRQKYPVSVIASRHGRAMSTVSKLVKASGVPLRYNPKGTWANKKAPGSASAAEGKVGGGIE